MTRFKAAAIHLSISALVALLVTTGMILVWYPGPFFTAMGGNDLVMILVGADVILGPLITLIIFNPAKPKALMRKDFVAIGMVQFAALAYGITVVALARPVYMVYTVDRFDLVRASDMRHEELARVTDERYKDVPWGSPVLVAARPPKAPAEQLRIMALAIKGYDLQTFPQHYVPYESMAAEALVRSRTIQSLRERHPEKAAEIDAELRSLGRTAENTRFLPLKAQARDYSVLMDAKSGAIVGYVKVDPW